MKTEIKGIQCNSLKSQVISDYNFFEVRIAIKTLDNVSEEIIVSVVKEKLKDIDWDKELLPPLPKTKEELVNCITSLLEDYPAGAVILKRDVTEFVNSQYKENE